MRTFGFLLFLSSLTLLLASPPNKRPIDRLSGLRAVANEETPLVRVRRNAVRTAWRRWPNGEIPYVISTQYGLYARKTIASAMKEFHDNSCVRFVPRVPSRHEDYVAIHPAPDEGCHSVVGRIGGRQETSVQAECMQVGNVIQLLMHTVGFFHEQSRTDRDEWVEILWENIAEEAGDQFEKYSDRQVTDLNEPYDYSSITHFGPWAFTKNGEATIRAKKAGAGEMGRRKGLSPGDIRKINKLYYCFP